MDRMTALQARILDKKLDGFFVTDAANVTYLTGFTGDESALLVTRRIGFVSGWVV